MTTDDATDAPQGKWIAPKARVSDGEPIRHTYVTETGPQGEVSIIFPDTAAAVYQVFFYVGPDAQQLLIAEVGSFGEAKQVLTVFAAEVAAGVPAYRDHAARLVEVTARRQRVAAELRQLDREWQGQIRVAGANRMPRARIAELAGISEERVYQILADR